MAHHPTGTVQTLARVEAEPDGDAVFPAIDPALWTLVHEEATASGPDDSAATRYSIYERRA